MVEDQSQRLEIGRGRGTRTLISTRGVTSDSPVWSPDAEWIYFGSNGGESWVTLRKRALLPE